MGGHQLKKPIIVSTIAIRQRVETNTMIRSKNQPACIWIAGFVVMLLSAGCAGHHPTTDLVSTGQVKVQPIASNAADLPAPSVRMSSDVMQIKGVVRRKPDYNGPLDGHVKIEILDPQNAVLAQFPIEWQPQDVPLTGSRQAEYALNYGWVPPEGTTLRISIVEDVDSVSLGGGGDSKGPRTAGNPQGLPTKVRTPSPTGTAKNGFAPGTPGTPHQRSSTPSTPGASRGGRGRR
jgi:hypothetical protein